MQGTLVLALVQEDPTCRGATKPVRHNYWACMPQLLKPGHPRAHALQQEKPPQWEARAPQRRVAPAHRQLEKATRSNKDPTQPKKETWLQIKEGKEP